MAWHGLKTLRHRDTRPREAALPQPAAQASPPGGPQGGVQPLSPPKAPPRRRSPWPGGPDHLAGAGPCLCPSGSPRPPSLGEDAPTQTPAQTPAWASAEQPPCAPCTPHSRGLTRSESAGRQARVGRGRAGSWARWWAASGAARGRTAGPGWSPSSARTCPSRRPPPPPQGDGTRPSGCPCRCLGRGGSRAAGTGRCPRLHCLGPLTSRRFPPPGSWTLRPFPRRVDGCGPRAPALLPLDTGSDV